MSETGVAAGQVVALLTADRSRLLAELRAGRVDVAKFKRDVQGSPVRIDASLADLDRVLKRAHVRYAETKARVERDEIRVRADVSEVERAARRAEAVADRAAQHAEARLRQTALNVAKAGATIAASLSGQGIKALGGQAAAGGAVAAAGEVKNLLGAILLLPAAGAAGAAGIAVLTVGFEGLGDAIAADDPAAWGEALQDLSPQARAAAIAVKGLGSAAHALRLDVQDHLFAGMASDITSVAGEYLPVLRRGLSATATEINHGAKSFSAFLLSGQSLRDTGIILDNTAAAFHNAAPAPAAFASILRDVTATGSDLLPGLSSGLAGVTGRWAAMVSQARQSGALAEWMRDGIDAASTLGSTVGNVVGTIGAVMHAGQQSGAGLLTTMEDLTGQMEDAAKSAEGQRVLGQILGDARQAALLLLPALGSVVQLASDDLGPLLVRVGQQIAPKLASSIDDVGQAVHEATPGMESLAGGTASVLDAGTDALPMLGRLAGLAGSVLGPALDVVGGALGGVLHLLEDLPAPIQAAVIALAAWRVAGDRVASGATSLGDRLTAPWRRFADQVRVQTDLAAKDGIANLSRLQAGMAVVESRSPAVARMADAYRTWSARVSETVAAHTALAAGLGGMGGTMTATASAVDRAGAAVGRLGGAAAGAAAAGMSGLKSAAGGLIGALGGPWGLAIGAAVTGLSLWAESSAKARAEQQALASAGKDLARVMREQGGVINEVVRRKAAQTAADQGLLQEAKKLGLGLSDVTDAIMLQGTSYDDLRARIQGAIASEKEYINAGTARQRVTQAHDRIAAYEELLSKIDSVTGATKGEIGTEQLLAEAMGTSVDGMRRSEKELAALDTAVHGLSSGVAGAADKVDQLTSALDGLAGDTLTVEEATQRVNDVTRGLGDAFKAAGDQAQGAKRGLLDATGAIDTTTEAGSHLQDTVVELASAYRQAYVATLQATGSHEQAAAAAEGARKALLDQATAALHSGDAARELAARYGLVPEFVRTSIEQPGMTPAQIALEILKGKIIGVPDRKGITVSSNAQSVIGLIEALGFKVDHLPDGTFRISAGTDEAQNAVDNFVSRNSGRRIVIGVTTSGANMPVGMRQPVMNASGRYIQWFDQGGIANAGFEPLSGKQAAIIASHRHNGTVRGIGDNPLYPELFVPLDPHNAQAQSLLDIGIRKMRPEWTGQRRQPAVVRGGESYVDRRRAVTYHINGPDARAVAREVRNMMRAEEALYGA
ncbi:hypothetical protein [Actinokineospora enzanensis]|uniref:hypothetical protein n=1 Tax=Actinokineospora enzanensis TaxID=155975 RepID=UPI00035E3D18|nr:hypothetical protein [Actinokineospora enzanensis]